MTTLEPRRCAGFGRATFLQVHLFAVVAAAGLLAGCSNLSLYFHNDAYEKSTGEVQDDVKKLDVAAAFKSLATQSETLAKDEDQAATAAQVAMRNRTLARLIDPNHGDWLDLQPAESGIPNSFSGQSAGAHLEYLIRVDLQTLAGTSDGEPNPLYLEGAQKLVEYDKLVRTDDSAVTDMRSLVRRAFKDLQVKLKVPIDCQSADQISGTDNPFPDLHPLIVKAFGALDGACEARADDVAQRDAFIAKLRTDLAVAGAQPPQEGVISRTARAYLEALQTKSESEKKAAALAHEVDALMATINEKTPEATAQALGDLIKKLDDADALAKLLGFARIDTVLQCGLLADLKIAQGEFAAADAKPATAASGDKDCSALFGDNPEAGKAVSGILKALMGVAADGVAADRLKRLNANILALADLRQRLSAAQITVAYVDNKLLLYKGQFYALLDQYRLLIAALEADLALPRDMKAAGFAEFRKTADDDKRRLMAQALSGYVASWNYGRIPLSVIDFRFIQARRNFDIQLASVTAANHKALVQPIADALAAYGKGGITPDTLAEVLSNLGIIGGLFLD